MSTEKTVRKLKLAAPLSFLIYLLPVPEIALNGHTWGGALWWMASYEAGGQANFAILLLAIAVHVFSFVLWFAFLVTPGAWKILFAPVGFALSIGGTIQLHQCTTQVWWPDWVLRVPEKPEKMHWPLTCSIPNAYLIASPSPQADAVDVYLTEERRSATSSPIDCRILERSEAEPPKAEGEPVTFSAFMMLDAYGCGFPGFVRDWRGVTHSGQTFPVAPMISMHDFARIWESEHVTVSLTTPGVIGRYPIELSWRLSDRDEVAITLPPGREVAWWSLSQDTRHIAFSVTNRHFRESVRDFIVVYETATGRETFRKYTEPLTESEVQFVGDRFVLTDLIHNAPTVAVYRISPE